MMNSMRFLMLLTFASYEMRGAQSSAKHLNYLKSLLLSKQPVVQEEVVYGPAFVQCDPPAAGDNGAETPDQWNPAETLPPNVEQKPAVIATYDVPSSTPASAVYGGALPVTPSLNVQVNSEIVSGPPEAEYANAYDKDMNPEWLGVVDVVKDDDEQKKPAAAVVVDVNKGVASLKDKIRAKIMLIKSKLKAMHPEPKPVVEIVEQDSPPFVPEQYDYVQHTTAGKPIEPAAAYGYSTTTGKPILEVSVTTGKPLWSTITTGRPYSTVESITTERPYSTAESITTGRPYSTVESITTGRPIGSILDVAAGPAVMIKPILKPPVFEKVIDHDAASALGGVLRPPSFVDLPLQQLQVPPKVYYYAPLPYRHPLWQKPLTATVVDTRYAVPSGYGGGNPAAVVQTGYQSNGYPQQPPIASSYSAAAAAAVPNGYQSNGYRLRPVASAAYPAENFNYGYNPSSGVWSWSPDVYAPAVLKSTATPLTLENTRYAVPQPPKIDDPSLTVKFENYNEGGTSAAPAAADSSSSFPYTGSYPSTTARPQPAGPAQPIAVYADEQQQRTADSGQDWTRAIEQQPNAELGAGPLRGDIPYANESNANKYAARDQTMAEAASSHSAETKVPAPPAPAETASPAKVAAPVVEKSTAEDEKLAA